MKRLALYLVLLTCVMGTAQDALAQTFAVKGVLRDPLGRTVADGNYSIAFKLYPVEQGGADEWSETHGSVATQHGVFGVELGTVNSLAALNFGYVYWLGITVENEAEMTPRIKLTTSPYSLAVLGSDNRVPSTGNVGFGTTTPNSKLHVIGDLEISGSRLHVDGDGIGVGTNAPQSLLHVQKGASGQTPHANSVLTLENDDSNFVSFLTPNANAQGFYFGDQDHATIGEFGYNHGNGSMWWFVEGGTRMTLTSSGLGIGSTAPDAPLTVVHDDGNVANQGAADPGGNWAAKVFNLDDQAGQGGMLVANRWAGSDATAFEVGSLYDNGNGFDSLLYGQRPGRGWTRQHPDQPPACDLGRSQRLLRLWHAGGADAPAGRQCRRPFLLHGRREHRDHDP